MDLTQFSFCLSSQDYNVIVLSVEASEIDILFSFLIRVETVRLFILPFIVAFNQDCTSVIFQVRNKSFFEMCSFYSSIDKIVKFWDLVPPFHENQLTFWVGCSILFFFFNVQNWCYVILFFFLRRLLLLLSSSSSNCWYIRGRSQIIARVVVLTILDVLNT